MRTEAIHVAAMAVRFVVELCAEEFHPAHASNCDCSRCQVVAIFERGIEASGKLQDEAAIKVLEEMSAQPCGCDMGCKPRPHYCERHAHLELCK
jgi:hypothetical protein